MYNPTQSKAFNHAIIMKVVSGTTRLLSPTELIQRLLFEFLKEF